MTASLPSGRGGGFSIPDRARADQISAVARTSSLVHACAVPVLQGLFGPVAIGVICFLLFIEEMGVPLPMFPATGMLLLAGVMIGAGDISPWFFLPLAYVACVGGALVGYAWCRRLGQTRLERLADRFRLRGHLDSAAKRLRRAGSIGVLIGRIMPGSRVYTSLVAGVIGMPLFTFVRGLVTSEVVYVGTLVGLGIVLGIYAADYVHLALAVLMRAVVIGVALLAALAVMRLLRPGIGTRDGERRRPPLRLVTAIVPDLAIVVVVAGAVSIGLAERSVLTDGWGLTIAGAVTLLIYVAVMRLAFRATVGERLARLNYAALLPEIP